MTMGTSRLCGQDCGGFYEQVLLVNEILIDQAILPPSITYSGQVITEEEFRVNFPKRWEYLNRIIGAATVSDKELEQISKWLYVVNSLDRYIARHAQLSSQHKTLWMRQLPVFQDIKKFLEQGEREGYIKLPTGTGKTVIFSELIEAVGLRTLIVVPKKILVEQTNDILNQFTEDLDIGRVYSEVKEHGSQITIITYQSLLRCLRRGIIGPNDYDFIILDEVHRALSHHRMTVIRELNSLVKIGFTATHVFSDKKRVSNLLKNEIHNMLIEEAVREGLLCPYSVIIVETDTDISEVSVMFTGDYNPKKLERAINIQTRNLNAVKVYKSLFSGKKAIAYCQGIRHATDLVEEFKRAGIPADMIHGKHNIGEQVGLKRMFETGKIKVLCNADILIEGFNDPSASVCLNLRPTLSRVVAEQRGGRVLRIDPNNPSKHAVIVEFVDKTQDRRKIQICFTEVSGALSGFDESDPIRPEFQVSPDLAIRVIGKANDVHEYVSRMVNRRNEVVPIGWATSYGLARLIGVRVSVINYTAEKFRTSHPEWFQFFHKESGKYNEFYSSQLVDAIRDDVKAKVIVPPNWRNVFDLSHEVRRMVRSITKVAARFGEGHPDWFRHYFDARGMSVEYYSPELVELIKNFFSITKR